MADFLDRIEIGQTGLKTGRIGIGSTFDAPRHAIENAFDRGINYLYWGRFGNLTFNWQWLIWHKNIETK